MNKKKKLIIFGTGDFAQIAYEYFTYDSEYEVCAFCLDKEYIKSETLFNIPIYTPEEIVKNFNPKDGYHFYVAIIYGKLNEIRNSKYQLLKKLGYKPANYISSKAFVWKNCKIGEHVFIFENNVVQPFSEIGNNVVLWSGNHIGHHSKIADNCFISSHVVISGSCEIGENCFIGVNSTIANNIKIGEKSWISHGSTIGNDLDQGSFTNSNNSDSRILREEILFRALEKSNKSK